MRRFSAVASLALLVGCGGEAAPDPAASPPAPPTTVAVAEPTTTVEEGGAGEIASTTTAAAPERPPAPDFSLTLGDGTVFTLSEEARPVFLVFWAEW